MDTVAVNKISPIVRSFHQLRRILTDEFGVERSAIRTDTLLSELISAEQLHQLRNALHDHEGRLPIDWNFKPKPMSISKMLATFLYAVISWDWLSFTTWFGNTIYECSRPKNWSIDFHQQIATVGHIAVYLATWSPNDPQCYWSRQDIELKVRLIIAKMACRWRTSTRTFGST